MTTLKPKTDRKIKCDFTNSLQSPAMYDMTASLEYLAKAEAEAKPLKKPRFFHRVCHTDLPVYHSFTRETGLTRLLYCIEGNALLISDDGQASFITAGSTVIVPYNGQYDLLLGRGDQSWITAHWEPESHYVPGTRDIDLRVFMLRNCSEVVSGLTERVIECGGETATAANFMLAWLNLTIHESKNSTTTFSLTPDLPTELENLADLVAAIKEKPHEDWNLNASSRFIGYSPFHLSRVFRSTIGMGLPKFVECCRTEIAIQRLLKGCDPIGMIATECGFGSSQAMRSAIRDFTGFLPLELRGRSGE